VTPGRGDAFYDSTQPMVKHSLNRGVRHGPRGFAKRVNQFTVRCHNGHSLATCGLGVGVSSAALPKFYPFTVEDATSVLNP
jgi:hypothetical protein